MCSGNTVVLILGTIIMIETPHPLPLSLAEVTPSWLTTALSHTFPGIRIEAAHQSDTRSGTASSARFELLYGTRAGHMSLPDSVYVKGGFDSIMRNRVWAALIQEAQFYRDFAGDAPVALPRAYYCGYDSAARQGIVILEDLFARQVRFGHATDDTTVDTLAAVVEGLAKLHAHFWDDPRLASVSSWKDPQRTFFRYLCRPSHWADVLERSYGATLLGILPSREMALAGLERMWAMDDSAARTLVHGDCHCGNLFYEPNGVPGFLDWQCVFPGAPAHDLAELIVTSLEPERRRTAERDLIQLYCDILKSEGVADRPSADELFHSYRCNNMHNLIGSVLNPYDMQTEEVTTISATRALAAAQELDTLKALGLD